MNEQKNKSHAGDQESGYETRDVNVRNVVIIGLLGIIVMILVLVSLSEYFTAVKEDQLYESVLRPGSVSLRELRAREDEILNSYKLVDAENGIYRVPISRAMELIAEEAFQARIESK